MAIRIQEEWVLEQWTTEQGKVLLVIGKASRVIEKMILGQALEEIEKVLPRID